jgi:hypothetical protein
MSETVTIKTSNVRNDDGELEPYLFTVHQNGLQHDFFIVTDYESASAAKAAATRLAEQLKATPWVSPFVKHRSVILADYGAATKIRRFVLSLYNGHTYPVDLSDISGMDKRHFGIILELMESYHKLGENDQSMLKLAEEIKKLSANGETH